MKKESTIIAMVLVLANLLAYPTIVRASEHAVILGVLEENVDSVADTLGNVHENYSRHIRVVFQKRGKEWKSFSSNSQGLSTCFEKCDAQFKCNNKYSCDSADDTEKCRAEQINQCDVCGGNCANDAMAALPLSYPAKVNWTIVFHGKNIGHVTSKKQKLLKYYADVGFQDIVGNSPIPTIGKRSLDYAGDYDGYPVYRPLISVSQPNFKDPDGWRPKKLSDAVIQLARKAFQQKFHTASNCASPDADISKPTTYKKKDIKILKSYISKQHWAVVRMALADYRCDYIIDEDSPFDDQWFVISPSKKVKYLGAGMNLIDAGDYDNNGKSELMFTISGQNEGGYKLFYDGFKKHATFEFNYH